MPEGIAESVQHSDHLKGEGFVAEPSGPQRNGLREFAQTEITVSQQVRGRAKADEGGPPRHHEEGICGVRTTRGAQKVERTGYLGHPVQKSLMKGRYKNESAQTDKKEVDPHRIERQHVQTP